MSEADMRDWLRGQGHQVSNRGKVAGRLKEEYYAANPDMRPAGSVALLPSPEEAWESMDGYEDMGLAEPYAEPEPPPEPRRYEAVPDAPEPPVADPEPAHASKEWRQGQKREAPRGGRNAPRKVTVTIRADISAKISLPLEMLGQVWRARDPVCGGVFLDQRPAIADAFTNIVCDSPDLVAWFTSGAGKYMMWFELVMACWPVAAVYGGHHVWHTIEAGEPDMTQPDYQDYAA